MRIKSFSISFLFFLLMIHVTEGQTVLRYNNIIEIEREGGNRFDVSSIISVDSNIFIVADKPWNNYLYQLNISERRAFVNNRYKLPIRRKIDLEGLDYCCGKFFFVDERQSALFTFDTVNSTIENIDLDLEAFDKDYQKWGNKSFEGIAVDSINEVIYLGKERGPKRIFKFDMKNNSLSEPFIELCKLNDFDISDMKYQDNWLYILDRKNFRILKVDSDNGNLASTYLYGDVMNCDNEMMYTNAKFPMAEGLLILHDEIWIILDNNAEEMNDKNKYISQSHLNGNNPLIVVFKRPKGF